MNFVDLFYIMGITLANLWFIGSFLTEEPRDGVLMLLFGIIWILVAVIGVMIG